jgi:CheY-like chemotaxis protein
MSDSTAGDGQLEGLRVVEDEALIALMLEDLLVAFGCSVVGPMARLAPAQSAARQRDFDCALLDININGEPIHPVAEILSERGIPFVFVTGYGEAGVDNRFEGRPVLRKPFRPDKLRAALANLGAAR